MNLHIIPNALIAWLGISFYAYAFLSGMPVDQIIWHSQVCLMAGIAGLAAFYFRVTGGGVIKLMAIGFLWLGLSGGFAFMAISFALTFVSCLIAKQLTGNESQPYLPFALLTLALLVGVASFDAIHQPNVENTAWAQQIK